MTLSHQQRPSKRQRLEHPPSWMDIESLEHVLVASDSVTHKHPYPNENEEEGRSSLMVTSHRTKTCTAVAGDIFLDRWQKEVCQACRVQFGQKGPPSLMPQETQSQAMQRTSLLRRMIVVGVNQVSQVLQEIESSSASIMNSEQSEKKTSSDQSPPDDTTKNALPPPSSSTMSSQASLRSVSLIIVVHPSHTSAAVLPWQHILVACARHQIPVVLLPSGFEKRLGQSVGNLRQASCIALCRRKQGQASEEDHSSSSIERPLEDFVEYVTNDFLKQPQYF